jgi:hypothetical protein
MRSILLFSFFVVGSDEHVGDLRVEAAHDRALRDQAVAVEGAAQRHHRAGGDDGLVEIEERSLHEREAYVLRGVVTLDVRPVPT